MSTRGYNSQHFATALGYEKVLEALLQGQEGRANFDTRQILPLHLATANGHLNCIRVLVDHAKRKSV